MRIVKRKKIVELLEMFSIQSDLMNMGQMRAPPELNKGVTH